MVLLMSCGLTRQAERRTSDCVTRRQMGHVFAGVTRAGAASERPYGRNSTAAEEVNRVKSSHKSVAAETPLMVPGAEAQRCRMAFFRSA